MKSKFDKNAPCSKIINLSSPLTVWVVVSNQFIINGKNREGGEIYVTVFLLFNDIIGLIKASEEVELFLRNDLTVFKYFLLKMCLLFIGVKLYSKALTTLARI